MPLNHTKIPQKACDALKNFFDKLDARAAKFGAELCLANRVSLAALNQLKGGMLVVEASVNEADSHKVYCSYTLEANGRDSWDADCSCAVGEGCQHVAAVALALIKLLEKDGKTPFGPKPESKSKPKPDDFAPPESNLAAFAEKLENALGRSLSAAEFKYAERFVAFWESHNEDSIFSADLFERFAAPDSSSAVPSAAAFGQVDSSENILRGMWDSYPDSPLELWQCVACALDERKIGVPEFMRAVTDFSRVAERLKSIRLDGEIKSWIGQFQEMLREFDSRHSVRAARHSAPLHDIRVTVEKRYLKWLCQTVPGAPWSAVKTSQLREWHARFVDGDDSLPDSYNQLIAAYLTAHSGDGYIAANLRFSPQHVLEESAINFLRLLLTRENLRNSLADANGRPVDATPVALHWRIAPDPQSPGYARFSLVADSEPSSSAWTPNPANLLRITPELRYDFVEAVLYKLPAALGGKSYAPASVPLEALMSAPGLRAVSRLRASVEGLELPALEMLAFAPVYKCSCSEAEDGASSRGNFRVELIARAPGISEISRAYTARGWSPLKLPPPPAAPARDADMSACAPAVAHLLNFKLRPPEPSPSGAEDSDCLRGDFAWTRAMTRAFPNDFAEWAAQARAMNIVLECAPLLADLLRAPEKMRVEINLDPASGGGIDWFDLRLSLTSEDSALTPDEIQLLVAARSRFVFLPGKGYRRAELSFAPEQERELHDLGLDPALLAPGQRQRLHALQIADRILNLLPEEHASRLRARRDALRVPSPPPLPDNLNATLRPYQAEGYHFLSHLADNSLGGILADDMGLGKTVQTLAWLLRLAQNKPAAKILIVCPKSVVSNWRCEAARFAPALLQAPCDFQIVNYARLRRDKKKFAETRWDAVVLDEGQNIKNPASLTAKAARELPSAHRLVLTGTPVENSTLDLWSLFAFAMPGLLGSQASFKRLYDARKDPLALSRLSRRVTPFMLRRSKAQVAAELPPRIEEDLLVELEPAQQKLYDAELKRARQFLLEIKTGGDFDAQRFNILHSLLRLRQICCHPALLGVKADIAESAKFEALFDQIEPILAEGHKLLIFSQFTTLLNLLSAEFAARGLAHLIITGKTENRQELVDRFQQTDAEQIFLLSLKAAGTGLNLTAASYVILFDPWWNPAVEAQAIDRTHRIGQSSQVVAYRLIAQNTVEEKIRLLQKEKAAIASAIVQEESLSTVLNLDDLRNILE